MNSGLKMFASPRSLFVYIGAVPFFFYRGLSPTVWADILMASYIQAAVLFGIALVGHYPPFRTGWFARSMGMILTLHLVSQVAFVKLALYFHVMGIRPPTRMFFGLVGAAVLLQGAVAFLIIDRLAPTRRPT